MSEPEASSGKTTRNFLLNISGAKDFYALLPFFYLGLALPSTGLNEGLGYTSFRYGHLTHREATTSLASQSAGVRKLTLSRTFRT